jgi:dodecin
MEETMAESVYKIVELVGTSTDSWEKATKAAVEKAAKTLRDLRIAEVVDQELVLASSCRDHSLFRAIQSSTS